jgi:hypothetical protein
VLAVKVETPTAVFEATLLLPLLKGIPFIWPQANSPEAPRRTIVLGVLVAVAVVAELETLPAVEIVSSFVSAMAAEALISALTIEPAVIAEAIAILADPSKEVAVPVISPEIAIVLAVASVVAVLALPFREPVIAPVTPKVPATVVSPEVAFTVNLLVLTSKFPSTEVAPPTTKVVGLSAPTVKVPATDRSEENPELPETFRVPATTVFPVIAATVNLFTLTLKSPAVSKVPATEVFPEAAITANFVESIEKFPEAAKVPATDAPTVLTERADDVPSPSSTIVGVADKPPTAAVLSNCG